MTCWYWLDKKMSELRDSRPENIRPKMSSSDRAKQFAPFAALGRMDELLKSVEKKRDVGDPEYIAFPDDLNEEEIAMMTSEHMDAVSEGEDERF